MNIQPREKREPSYDGLLAVHSIFQTIQGEGPFCGTPCVFIRLAGCNLQCPACDTDYTSKREMMSVDDLLFKVRKKRGSGLVVLTGGEPFRQHVGELIWVLTDAGYYVQVESNGTMNPPEGPWSQDCTRRAGAYLVISPKTGKLNPLALEAACALKYVVRAGQVGADGLPLSALDMPNPPARPPQGWERWVYVQPMDSTFISEDANDAQERNAANIAAAVQSCMEHDHTLQLQIHKLVGVE